MKKQLRLIIGAVMCIQMGMIVAGESIRQQQERALYAPHLPAGNTIRQQQENAMAIHAATSAVNRPQPQPQQKR